MYRYMVIKVFKDGQHKAEFLNEGLDGYLLGLRTIDRDYIVFEWSELSFAYVQISAWKAGV